MIRDYVTLKQAAGLEQLNYFTFYRRYERTLKSGSANFEKVTYRGYNNKKCPLVPTTFLSAKARKIRREAVKTDTAGEWGRITEGMKINMKIKEAARGALVVNNAVRCDTDEKGNCGLAVTVPAATPDCGGGKETGGGDTPWYIGYDVNEYMAKYPENYRRGAAIYDSVARYTEYRGKNKAEFAAGLAAGLNISAQSFYRFVKLYIQCLAITGGQNAEGGGRRVLCLCRKPYRKREGAALNEQMRALIQKIWFSPDTAKNLYKREKVYRVFRREAEYSGWDKTSLPSYMTVSRYIDDLEAEGENARFLLTRGEREFKRVKGVKGRRDCGSLKAMELVAGDTHTFDCFVTAGEGKRQRVIRPLLVGFMDMRTRALVGFGVCETSDSQTIKDVLFSMVMEKTNPDNPFWGVPKVLLIDNGKDYTSQYLTGRSRKQRTSRGLMDESELAGIYAELGIERDMRSLPYHAWVKGQVERFFGTICEDFTKELASYKGTLTGSLTSGKVVKNLRDLQRNGELLDIADFAARFENWVLNIYHKREHKGLKEQKEANPTPLGAWQTAEHYLKAAPPMRYLKERALVRVTRFVRQTGIRLLGCDYMAEGLLPYINTRRKVIVGYDRKDAGRVFVYDGQSKEFICEAENIKLLNPLAPVGDKDLEAHLRIQKRQLKQAKEIIEKMQSGGEPIDAAGIESKNRRVITPKIKKKQSVIAMPPVPANRRTRGRPSKAAQAQARELSYRQAGAEGKKPEEKILTSFLEKMAEEALLRM